MPATAVLNHVKFCATCCLREHDVKMLERCIQLDRECASICHTASRIMSMDGEHAPAAASSVREGTGQTSQTNSAALQSSSTTTNKSAANASSPATVPEFPLFAPPILLTTVIIGLIVFMTRAKRFRIGSNSALYG